MQGIHSSYTNLYVDTPAFAVSTPQNRPCCMRTVETDENRDPSMSRHSSAPPQRHSARLQLNFKEWESLLDHQQIATLLQTRLLPSNPRLCFRYLSIYPPQPQYFFFE